jgi:Plavaka transposase
MPCDSLGNYLPPDALPPPYILPGENGVANNHWDPFYNRAQFEIADFLYRRNQMPGTQIDCLFDLWAASGNDGGTEPPFASHIDLYETIDSIQLGDLPWICFTIKYNGPLPDDEDTVPTWMLTEYEVWCRDVRLLICGQLANPDFNGEIDYTPLQIFGATGKREWSNVMTGNWAWKQAVRYFRNFVSRRSTYANFFSRTSLPKILRLMAVYLFLSSLAVTRQRFR